MFIERELDCGVTLYVSFKLEGLEEELGLDYGTLDECLEIKIIDGVKLYFVYI